MGGRSGKRVCVVWQSLPLSVCVWEPFIKSSLIPRRGANSFTQIISFNECDSVREGERSRVTRVSSHWL